MQQLMQCVDDLSQDTNKYFNYQRQVAKQQQSKQQFVQKRVSGHCISINLEIRLWLI